MRTDTLGKRKTTTAFDPLEARRQFPALNQQIHGHPLVYLDNAATTQKPFSVIETIDHYYRQDNSNIHRGLHSLAERATRAYESTRAALRRYLNAANDHEIVFTRGTTDSINLVAGSYGRAVLRPGDRVLITEMEHHSNIVPWQLLCEQSGAVLDVAPIDDSGELMLAAFEERLTPRTRIVACTQISNALGTVNPISELIELSHAAGAVILVDGAQAVAHQPIDLRELGCDFYAFSGHKAFGPTGIGVLYGRSELLESMPPYQGGGDMIKSVTFKKTEYADPPYRFEAGTPNIAGGIGLGAAVAYLSSLDFAGVAAHEEELLAYAVDELSRVPGLRLIGTPASRSGVVSFVLDKIHPYDMAPVLDRRGIAVRTGHHCAQPTMDHFGVPATVRASFALYNTRQDVDALIAGLDRVCRIFS